MKKTISSDKFDGIIALMEEKFKDVFEKLDRIEEHTAKTNGEVANLKAWKSFSVGATSVITAIVIPLLLYMLYIHFVPVK